MIDTIVLTLNHHMYRITQPDLFTPSAQWALSNSCKQYPSIPSKQNPTKRELQRGIYKPRLTLSPRVNSLGTREIMLKIELSLPKLIFGNNFAELRYKNFPLLISKLVAALQDMGIEVTPEALTQAAVSAIHYSKNIQLTDGSTPYYYIRKIKESNAQLSLDVNQTDYRNEGHSYKWHANSYEIAFYDKIKDLEQAKISSKRAVEKDSSLQLSLLKSFQQRRNLEYLRMEVRLNNRTKIKQLFKKLNIAADLTFKKLFKPAIAKKILLHYLDEIERKRPILLDYKVSSDKALLVDLIFNNPDMSPKQIMQLYGLKQALNIMNPRELRTIFTRSNTRGWHRLIAETQKAKLPHAPSPLRGLREQLVKFEMVKSSFFTD